MRAHELAIVGEVDSEIHKVVTSKARFIDNVLQHSLVDLIRDVT